VSVRAWTEGAVARVAMARPEKRNAQDTAMLRALDDAFSAAMDDDAVRVVVLSGDGPHFCAGHDLGALDEELPSPAGWMAFEEDAYLGLHRRWWNLPKPTIAMVQGACIAGGLATAWVCDLIVAADDARFGEPEIRYGSGPVTLLMPFLLGQKKTNELLFTGDAIDATEAERTGLVNRVVGSDELEGAVDELVRKIAPTPLPVLRLTKLALVRAYEEMGLRSAVLANLDLSAILNAADTPEQREFDEIVSAQGLKAALAWRDSRYGEELGKP
jgi:enoyl-CoA hydratase